MLYGPINGVSFRAYVEQFLVRTLALGDIVIMDNLGSHKGHLVRRAIHAAGARPFFLPPHSPDLNTNAPTISETLATLRREEIML